MVVVALVNKILLMIEHVWSVRSGFLCALTSKCAVLSQCSPVILAVAQHFRMWEHCLTCHYSEGTDLQDHAAHQSHFDFTLFLTQVSMWGTWTAEIERIRQNKNKMRCCGLYIVLWLINAYSCVAMVRKTRINHMPLCPHGQVNTPTHVEIAYTDIHKTYHSCLSTRQLIKPIACFYCD